MFLSDNANYQRKFDTEVVILQVTLKVSVDNGPLLCMRLLSVYRQECGPEMVNDVYVASALKESVAGVETLMQS